MKTRSQIANLGPIWKVYFQSRRGYALASPPLAVCETNLTRHVHYLGFGLGGGGEEKQASV